MLARLVWNDNTLIFWVPPAWFGYSKGDAGYQGSKSQCSKRVWFLQISGASHFSNDLGLDSLDTVEVVMAIEEVC